LIDSKVTTSLAICDAADKGPWRVWKNGYRIVRDVKGQEKYVAQAEQRKANAIFIAHARTALPIALNEIKRLRKLNADVRAMFVAAAYDATDKLDIIDKLEEEIADRKDAESKNTQMILDLCDERDKLQYNLDEFARVFGDERMVHSANSDQANHLVKRLMCEEKLAESNLVAVDLAKKCADLEAKIEKLTNVKP